MKGRLFISALCVSCVLSFVLVDSARGQHLDAGIEGVSRKPDDFKLRVGYHHVFDADIDRDGNFHMDSMRTSMHANVPVRDKFNVGGHFVYQYDSYDFSGNADYQWDEVHMFQFGPNLSWALDNHVSLLGGAIFRFHAEDEGDFGEAFTFGVYTGVSFVKSESLTIGAAIAVVTQIEDDPAIAPVPIVNWEFRDAWRLRTGVMELGGRSGLGADVVYSPNNHWDLSFGLVYERNRFRLSEQDTIGEESSLPLFTKITWKPVEQIALDGIIGFTLMGDLRLEDSDGDRLESEEYNPALFLGTALSVTF